MEKRIIVATKHNTRRNGSKTSVYWSIEENIDNIEIVDDLGYLRDDIINQHWEHSKLPKKIKDILETSKDTIDGFSLKQDKFLITVEDLDEDGNFEFDNIIEIKKFERKQTIPEENKYVKCFDKFGKELKEGDIVDVQKDGEHKIYKKEDGQLYFKPYKKEDRVSAYFSNDIIKV
jgi:hypothetical protein